MHNKNGCSILLRFCGFFGGVSAVSNYAAVVIAIVRIEVPQHRPSVIVIVSRDEIFSLHRRWRRANTKHLDLGRGCQDLIASLIYFQSTLLSLIILPLLEVMVPSKLPLWVFCLGVFFSAFPSSISGFSFFWTANVSCHSFLYYPSFHNFVALVFSYISFPSKFILLKIS